MKLFYLFLFSILFIPFISYSQNKVQSKGTEFKEDVWAREEYFRLRDADHSPFEREEAVKQRKAMTADKNTLSKTSTTDWVSLSPNGEGYYDRIEGYVSGHTRAIAFDPTDSNIVYVGAHTGGVWKTTNGGINWAPLTDDLSSPNVGDVVVDQRNPNIVYYASGGNFSGVGLYKSTDAGATWTNIGSAATLGVVCEQFAIDPVNSNILYWGGALGVMKSTNGGSSWINTNSGNQCTSFFVNSTASIGTAVGGSGKIRRTTDGGTTWTAQTSGVTETLYGVYFVDAKYGTVVGANGKILHTTNGGSNWSSQTSGTTNTFKTAYFYNANKGWAVGQNGMILYTTNGGSSWTAQTSNTTNFINSVSFSDSITGTVVGATGTILRTVNGGTTWTAQTSGTTNALMGVSFSDANNGTAVGVSGTILRTTNGGANWSSQTSGTTNGLYGVSFYGSKIGQVVGLSGTILRTTNGGANWTSQTSGITDNLMGASFTDNLTGSTAGANGKILRTTDGGINWTSQTSGETIQFQSVQFVYNDTKILIAAIGTNGSLIKKSTNAGVSWTTIDKNIGNSNRGEIKLAPYKQYNNIIYASVAYTQAGGSGLLGLYKTTDFGSNWTLQNSSTNYLGTVGFWANSVIVKNSDPNSIFVGGYFPVYKSTDGGVNLTAVSSNYSPDYVHPDIHRFGINGNTLYCCNDGGITKTTNDGQTWNDLNRTISTFEFPGADYLIMDNNNKIMGGTQDNGTIYTTNGGTTWDVTSGDAGTVCIDQADPNFVYRTLATGVLIRDSSWYSTFNWQYITPSGSIAPGLFYVPFKMAPGDNNTLFLGRTSLWKTSNAKTCTPTSGWTKIDSVGSDITAIGISHTNINKFYYGYSQYVKATTNNGSTWTTATFSGGVEDITVDNTNDNVAYVCFRTINKVAKTTNGGTSWTYINGTLPSTAYNSIVLRTSPSRMLFVGSDVGVFQSTDDGTTWVSFNSGLPICKVSELKYYQSANKLMAVTYGRSNWMFDLSGLGKDMFAEVPKVYSLSENFPNPFNPQTHIQFDIPVPDNVKLTVYDVTGREVETLIDNRMNAGKFEVTFDGSKYASGVYLYRLTVGNSFVDTKKMILLK